MEGRPIQFLPPYRRELNTVFQNYALFPHMSVWDNVAYGLKMRRVPKAEMVKRVGETLGLVHLDELARRAPRQLSGRGVSYWTDGKGDERILYVTTGYRLVQLNAKTGALVLTLPLGLNLTEPVTVKVDNGAAERQPIQTCTNVGCFVAMTLTDKMIAAMRTGGELKITVQDANKKPIDMGLPLLGFGLAFDKAK